jgi:2-polyprenyl-6-methoxyphenol hydroxylase-like FAD-dependent oxidoreductase
VSRELKDRMESRVQDTRVLLMGAGLGGLTAAIFLKMAQVPFRIFEASPIPTDIGGTVTIFPNGMRVMRDCGVKDAMVSRGASTRRAIVQDQWGRPFAVIPMGAAEIYGEPTVTIRRSLLHRLLIERAEGLGVEIEYGRRLVDIEQVGERVHVQFQDSTRARGEVLIGADGIGSRVREFVIPESARPAYSGLVFFAGFVDDESLMARAALDRSAQYVTVGPIGFFGYSHVDHPAEPRQSVLWNCYLRQAERLPSGDLKALSDEAIRTRVGRAHLGWHWPVPDLIQNAATFCRASIFEVIGLRRWSSGRALLIGDAAHAMNPVAGQGANMALEDAQLVAELLSRSNLPVEPLFRHFEDVRKPRVTAAARQAHRSSRRTMVRVGTLSGWLRNRAYALWTRIVPDAWTTRRFRYEIGRDREEILRRLTI